jgi:hypothetical protein
MIDLEDKAERLRVVWEKARNMYTSFFAELSEVSESMKPEEFHRWCYEKVGVSLSVALKTADVLREADALHVKAQLKHVDTMATTAVRQERAKAKEAEANAKKAQAEAQQATLDLTAKKEETKLKIESTKKRRVALNEIKSDFHYVPEDRDVAKILERIATRDTRTRTENGEDFLKLKEMVKDGRMGNNPATSKKWTWTKWAPMALKRSLRDVDKCISEYIGHNARKSPNALKTNGSLYRDVSY